MTLEPLGEAALILRDLAMPAHLAASLLRHAWPEVEDVVPVFDEVGVYFGGGVRLPGLDEIDFALEKRPAKLERREHMIPVCYELGEDSEAVGEFLGIRFEEIVRLHSGAEYECRAIGFCPGFGYLSGLPGALCGLPRKSSPRVRVEPGSVAITGSMTAVYPLVRPGGWWIIGRTPLTLVDEAEGYFPIRVGDTVRFVSISYGEFESSKGERL